MGEFLSEADAASRQLLEFLKTNSAFLHRNAPDLSESDTRAKLIDPLFRTLLGWHELDIRREEPAADGYADYVFGAEFVHFHVEAKRLRPRFEIAAPGRNRVLKLDGSHLLGRKDLRPHIEQAAKYAHDLGSEVAILTNGEQFIIFRTHIPGRSWKTGSAIVWHDYDDIRDDFPHFYGLLSRDRVRAGSLLEAFERAEGITTNLWSPLERIHNPNAEFVRNPFWNKIARVVSPLLTDDPEASDIQEEIIRHCYVRTPLSDQADSSINQLLRDQLSPALKDAGAQDIKPGMRGATSFDIAIEADIKSRKPGTYILTGGVGSGKTTFLRRFATVVQASFVREWCIWLHVDYLSIGNVVESRVEDYLQTYTFERMRELLRTQYPQYYPATGEGLRELFAKQIRDAEMTLLHGLPRESATFQEKVNSVVDAFFHDDRAFVQAVLRKTAVSGRRIVLVLDNTDQQGERFQEAVFLLSQRLSKDCAALTIVALREEKFFAAYRRGIFDAYGDKHFHIGSPNLEDVIRQRLWYALKKYEQAALRSAMSEVERADVEEVGKVIEVLIQSTTQRNQNIVRLLACVSNGDMRHALGMFKEFLSSGNTDVRKIVEIVRSEGNYTVPFHEFAKSAILGSRRYYSSDVGHIINLFSRSASAGSSHLTAIRILARLANAASSPSKHGDGFVDTAAILAECRQSFGRADDFVARLGDLLTRGLIESEPPRAPRPDATEALRIAASGMYYWRYLVRSFAYLDLVHVDTAIVDKEIAARLAVMATSTEMPERFERVRLFLDYLARVERDELGGVSLRGGPYSKALVPEIREQIETEIRSIRQRRRSGRLAAPVDDDSFVEEKSQPSASQSVDETKAAVDDPESPQDTIEHTPKARVRRIRRRRRTR